MKERDEREQVLASLTLLDLRAVCAIGLLKQSALQRILAAPSLPLPEDPTVLEAAQLTLAIVVDWAHSAAIQRSTASKEALDRVRKAWRDFAAAVQNVSRTSSAFPEHETMSTLSAWVDGLPRPTPSKQRNRRDHTTFPLLLACFRHTYGQEPGQTINGPAARFLSSFNEEMRAALDALPPPPPGMFEMRPAWPLLTDANTVRKIVDHRAEPWADAWVRDILEKLRANAQPKSPVPPGGHTERSPPKAR